MPIRGRFSLDTLAKTTGAKERGLSLIVTSTCNRTEIYGFAEHPSINKVDVKTAKCSVQRISKVGYKNQSHKSYVSWNRFR
jgi:glutamyl-tRNA reductase